MLKIISTDFVRGGHGNQSVYPRLAPDHFLCIDMANEHTN